MTGLLDVLNCNEGHIRIEFDKADAAEVARAKRIIQDMLRRGYLLFVEHKGQQKQVKRFDPKEEVYILADGPEKPPEPLKRKSRKGIPMRKTRATGVGPTAGG
jgi:hypothetical protein